MKNIKLDIFNTSGKVVGSLNADTGIFGVRPNFEALKHYVRTFMARTNPIWRGGGVAHGPKPKDWRIHLSKKLKTLALVSSLSLKNSRNQLLILDTIPATQPRTKFVLEVFKNLGLTGSALFVLDEKNESFLKSTQNLKDIRVTQCSNLNVFDVMKYKNTIFVKEAVVKLQEKYATE
ncbi:MAG: 50S ribosomal protein L4 [candidate division WWE3 bacterium GW2011_GWA2_46_9]|uniref:Large ribosomal subunit protein uL4 n=1 Tax=candidate division WWE3 bacterium GW2011_GWA2_46_9 TaxID=1619111 RepID=A0A0G1T2D0_UNCKA|nr:MAG: 50S ribosomal protein L4 [candidate division WWE3 bacterium GW2011_GWA2_46_9]